MNNAIHSSIILVLFCLGNPLMAQLSFTNEVNEHIDTITLDATGVDDIVTTVFSIKNDHHQSDFFMLQRELFCQGNTNIEELLCFTVGCYTVDNADSLWQTNVIIADPDSSQFVRASYFNLSADADYLSIYKYRLLNANNEAVMDSLTIIVYQGEGTCGEVIPTTDLNSSRPLFKISPNPATENLFIRLDDHLGMVTINIYDLQGKIYKTLQTRKSFINFKIDGLTPGMYWISIQNDYFLSTNKFLKIN